MMQFDIMKKKTYKAILKLNNIVMKPYLTYLYFNGNLLKIDFSRSRIIEFTKAQDKALRSIYELMILKKLHLSSKFLKEILHSRKSALGIGLLTSITVIKQWY